MRNVGELRNHGSELHLLIFGGMESLHADAVLSAIERFRSACGDQLAIHDTAADWLLVDDKSSTVFIAGVVSGKELRQCCMLLRQLGWHVTILFDALKILGHRSMVLADLEETGFQISHVEAAVALAQSRSRFLYACPKVEVASSVVLVCAKSNRVLLIRREPVHGLYSLPGGLLKPFVESVEDCAVRELYEKSGIRIDANSLRLVTVRSSVNGDIRGHVVDLCYFASAHGGLSESDIAGGDTMSAATLMPLNEALGAMLAAGQSTMLKQAVRQYWSRPGCLQRMSSRLATIVQPLAGNFREIAYRAQAGTLACHEMK